MTFVGQKKAEEIADLELLLDHRGWRNKSSYDRQRREILEQQKMMQEEFSKIHSHNGAIKALREIYVGDQALDLNHGNLMVEGSNNHENRKYRGELLLNIVEQLGNMGDKLEVAVVNLNNSAHHFVEDQVLYVHRDKEEARELLRKIAEKRKSSTFTPNKDKARLVLIDGLDELFKGLRKGTAKYKEVLEEIEEAFGGDSPKDGFVLVATMDETRRLFGLSDNGVFPQELFFTMRRGAYGHKGYSFSREPLPPDCRYFTANTDFPIKPFRPYRKNAGWGAYKNLPNMAMKL